MRVLIVNTSERTGGAAIAAARLREALGNNGVKATMLVSKKETDAITVAAPHDAALIKYNFLRERFAIWKANGFHKHRLFETDAARFGVDITGLKEFKEADVIHLHWVNQGFISLKGIAKILRCGKPVVWTMHDMWPFTGICHYTGECDRFKNSCGKCPLLYRGGYSCDLSCRVFARKRKLYRAANITFVACSDWLAESARSSALLEGKRVLSIPNPINMKLYCPRNMAEARESLALPLGKKLLLFAAYRVTNKIKGIDYLCQAISKLADEHPDITSNIAVVAVGKESDALKSLLPVKVYSFGYVSNEKKMIDIYNACNLFLIPTMQDNLPNTIMESMSCGVSCVAFNVGGIPQMIDHKKNGYIAEYKNAGDFAEGILWSLSGSRAAMLSEAARAKVAADFSEAAVSRKYIDLYSSIAGGRDD